MCQAKASTSLLILRNDLTELLKALCHIQASEDEGDSDDTPALITEASSKAKKDKTVSTLTNGHYSI